MKDFFTKLWKRFSKGQSGFTLAELIVVVAIIVGLAAVILPNVGRFTGQGQEGANATERNSVQTALDAWAADDIDNFPVPLPTGDVTTDLWGASGTIDLVGAEGGGVFLRLPGGGEDTDQAYCWDTNGTITFATTTAGAACP